MSNEFVPLEGYCLCNAPGHETTEGGIVVPEAKIDGEKREPLKLRVVKVGPGEQMDAGRRREVVLEEGGTYWFLFPSYSLGAPLTLGGKRFVVVQSKFVCGRAT
jgi:co-chaperonin GroES (HSP10)